MTHPRYTGRAQRVRDFLAKLRPHGATLDLLLSAVDRNCRPLNMSATVGTLVTAGKVRKAKVRGVTRYYATDTINVDGRIAANAVGKRRKHPKLRAPAGAAPAPSPAERLPRIAKAKRPAAAPADTRAPLQRFAATRSPQLQRPPAAAESVDEFLARGGHIDRLPVGAVSQPLKYDHRAANEASWQARLRRLAAADH